MTPRGISTWALKLGLGGVFAAAAIPKLVDPATFVEQIVNYQFVPSLAPVMATVLPGLELVLAAVLVAAPLKTRWLPAAALLVTGLMAVFVVAMAQAAARGIDIDCGCFGGDSGPISAWTFVRDAGFLAASCALLWLVWPHRSHGGPNQNNEPASVS